MEGLVIEFTSAGIQICNKQRWTVIYCYMSQEKRDIKNDSLGKEREDKFYGYTVSVKGCWEKSAGQLVRRFHCVLDLEKWC